MNPLFDGVQRFKRLVYPDRALLFRDLARGQSPEVLFITCADSRIDPNLITQSEPGQLFIVRNAGNMVPPWGTGDGSTASAIEYAIEVLNVKHVVVCGHAHCGAISALLREDGVPGLPAVSDWLRHAEATRRFVARKHGHCTGEEQLRIAIEHNAKHQLDNLRTHPAVASRLSDGALQLHAWVYDIGPGSVLTWDATSGAFQEMLEDPGSDEVPATA